MLPTIFCPDCQTYIGPQATACPDCRRARLPSERLPEPGQPLWTATLENAVHSAVIAGELVVFNYGDRNKQGGVAAFQRSSGEPGWSYQTRHSVEAGIASFGDRLFFATCGFLGGGAELVCLQAEDGKLLWKQELTGGVWSKPVVNEARVYLGQDDGQVGCFDIRNGMPLCYPPAELPRGRIWLEQADGVLLAFSSSGQVMAFNPQGLERRWHAPLEVGCKISSPPCAATGKVFFGGEDGLLLVLDVRQRKISILAQGLKSVVAAPACSEKLLFVGAHDHRLHAYDLSTNQPAWQSEPFEHSISSAPYAADGLVLVPVNQAGLFLLDAHSGELAWHFPVEKDANLLSHPILQEGVIYAGTDTGQVFALTWHLGQYGWAARLCQAREDFVEAGVFFILAARHTRKMDKKDEYYQQAVSCWQEAGRMELAGRLWWEGLIEEKKAAEAYIQAGQLWKGSDNQRAAEFYNLAAQLYWQLGDESAFKDCAQLTQKLALGPLLRVSKWTDPQLTQYKEDQKITFRVENVGKKSAENLALNLGGSLVAPVTCQVLDPLPAGTGSYFDVTLTLTPTKVQNDLVIQAEYCAPGSNKFLFTTFRTEVKAEEVPIEWEIKDVVALRGIEITNPQNRRMRIKLDAVIASTIKIGEPVPGVTPAPAPAPVEFTWPEPPTFTPAEEQDLIQVIEVDDECVVPAAHWAIFLADEAIIDTVAPGRYTRRDYSRLQLKLTVRHRPAWKAVFFSSSPFRLAYQLGPFRTQEGVQVGVQCGLTAQLDDTKPLDLWKGILADQSQLTTSGLASWLEHEVAGTLEKWVAGQAEVSLVSGFRKREEVMLSLQEELKTTHARYGVSLQDPLYLLNFVIPGRERVANRREEIYWQQQEHMAEENSNRCPKCATSLPPGARHCDHCGKKLG